MNKQASNTFDMSLEVAKLARPDGHISLEVTKLAQPGGLARSARNYGRAGPLNYWSEKNRAKFGPARYGPARYGPARPGLPEFFLP